MRTTDAGEGGVAEACTAGVLGCFEVCGFCDLQGVHQLASTAASLRSDKRRASAKPTLQVWSAVLISVGSAMSHCVNELAPTTA